MSKHKRQEIQRQSFFILGRKIFFKAPVKFLSYIISGFCIGVFYLCLPFKHFRIGFIHAEWLGVLSMPLEIFSRKRQQGYFRGIQHIFISRRSCNRQLLAMWKREHFIIESPFLLEFLSYAISLWRKTPFLESLEYILGTKGQRTFQKGAVTLKFTSLEQEKGEKFLDSFGIKSEKDWFVCIFARDSEYRDREMPGTDWSYHDYRDADIDTYIPAIKHIIEKGGYVFRIGHHVRKAVNFHHERFIDYAVQYRDDFLDVYLIGKCKFFLGGTSGPQDLSCIFDRPTLGVNHYLLNNRRKLPARSLLQPQEFQKS